MVVFDDILELTKPLSGLLQTKEYRVAPAVELRETAAKIARTIAANAPLTLRSLKTSIGAALRDARVGGRLGLRDARDVVP